MSLEENTIPFEVLSQGTLAALDTALAELQASQLSLPRGAQQCVEAPQRLACTPQAQCPAPAPCQPPLEVFCEAVSPHEFLVFGCGLQAARARLEAARLPFFDAAHSAPGSAPALRLHLGHYESALGVLAAAQLLRSPRPGVPRSCIPHSTLCTLGALARAAQPGTREYLAQSALNAQADARFARLPPRLRARLLPFQQEGVMHLLCRGGRALLADEMGVGKTLQAIAVACAFQEEGPLLVVTPASLRCQWAEELERWVPRLRPSACTLVFSSKDKAQLDDLPRKPAATRAMIFTEPQPAALTAVQPAPRAVVVSFRMLEILRRDMGDIAWGMVIVDESHCMRTTTGLKDSSQTEACAGVVRGTRRALLLSGTPSLNRPFDLFRQVDSLAGGMLGKRKEEFGDCYCERIERTGSYAYSASGGARLEELHMLLSSTGLLLRRTKADVAAQLPPKRRQVVRLLADEHPHPREPGAPSISVAHSTGLGKLPAVNDWLLATLLRPGGARKVVVFAHHKAVLNGIASGALEACSRVDDGQGGSVPSTDACYVRVDGETDPAARAAAVRAFREDARVRVALVSITAGGTGLDFSVASAVVFAELPLASCDLEQGEARVHRRGATGDCINIYFLCARGTDDETRWTDIAARLQRCHTVHGEAGGGHLDVDEIVDAAGGYAREAHPELTQPMDGEAAADAPPSAFPARSQSDWPVQPTGRGAPAREVDDGTVGELWFESSASTERVHVYHRPPGSDAEQPPQHTCTVHPSELRAAVRAGSASAVACLPWPLSARASARAEACNFLGAFQALSALERKRVCEWGQPMLVPLRPWVELAEERHARLLADRAPSTRRAIKPRDLGPPAPRGAQLRYVVLRSAKAGRRRDVRHEQWLTPAGVWLCVACKEQPSRVQHPAGRDALVESLLDLCCTVDCHSRYLFATNPSALRRALHDLDKGVCRECGLDCDTLEVRIKALSPEQRPAVLQAKEPRFALPENQARLNRLAAKAESGDLWHADHILPVCEGGGLCGLENMRTLCVLCHRDESSLLAGVRASRRAKKKHAPREVEVSAEERAAQRAARLAFQEHGDGDFKAQPKRRRAPAA